MTPVNVTTVTWSWRLRTCKKANQGWYKALKNIWNCSFLIGISANITEETISTHVFVFNVIILEGIFNTIREREPYKLENSAAHFWSFHLLPPIYTSIKLQKSHLELVAIEGLAANTPKAVSLTTNQSSTTANPLSPRISEEAHRAPCIQVKVKKESPESSSFPYHRLVFLSF